MSSNDPIAIAPHAYRVLLENDRVRVLDVRMKPGEKTDMHAHPDAVWYLMAAASARFTAEDGSAFEGDLPAGVMWRPAELHGAENIGTAEMVAIAVELK